MKNKDSLTPQKLNELICIFIDEMTGKQFTVPQQWRRVDCADIEVYVGDGKYVITLVDKLSESNDEIVNNQINAEETIIKYLKSEGFIGENFPDDGEMYLGLQQFAINKLLGNDE